MTNLSKGRILIVSRSDDGQETAKLYSGTPTERGISAARGFAFRYSSDVSVWIEQSSGEFVRLLEDLSETSETRRFPESAISTRYKSESVSELPEEGRMLIIIEQNDGTEQIQIYLGQRKAAYIRNGIWNKKRAVIESKLKSVSMWIERNPGFFARLDRSLRITGEVRHIPDEMIQRNPAAEITLSRGRHKPHAAINGRRGGRPKQNPR